MKTKKATAKKSTRATDRTIFSLCQQIAAEKQHPTKDGILAITGTLLYLVKQAIPLWTKTHAGMQGAMSNGYEMPWIITHNGPLPGHAETAQWWGLGSSMFRKSKSNMGAFFTQGVAAIITSIEGYRRPDWNKYPEGFRTRHAASQWSKLPPFTKKNIPAWLPCVFALIEAAYPHYATELLHGKAAKGYDAKNLLKKRCEQVMKGLAPLD